MFKRFPILGLFFTFCISCGMLACTEKTCDDVQIDVCNGTFVVTGCGGGEPIQHDCKEQSQTALCGMFKNDEFGVSYSTPRARCYEPCTTKDEKKLVCIDHTSDKNYNPSFCIMRPSSTECEDIPSQRPDSYRYDVCKQDEGGILYWDKGGEDNCFNPSNYKDNTCCFKEGKLCSNRFGECQESTNTAFFCNRNYLVEKKSCNDFGEDYVCNGGAQCCNGNECKDMDRVF